VGFFGMGAVSLNRPAMIDHPMTGIPRPEVTGNPVSREYQMSPFIGLRTRKM
jgi:hypothetical protein